MARKVNTDFTTTSWAFLHDEIAKIQQQVGGDLNAGLEEATHFLADKLQEQTPVETGITKASWVKQLKYKNVKYINNTAVNKNGMPIINILEFAKKRGKPFVRKTLSKHTGDIEQIIIRSLEKGDSNG